MKRIFQVSLMTAALAASALAIAQPSGYAGPSSKPTAKAGAAAFPLMQAKDLLAKGKDGQNVRLQGKLLNHTGGENYVFADASGKMKVEIDDDRFPEGARIDQNTVVELIGEFDKNTFGESALEVNQIKLVTK